LGRAPRCAGTCSLSPASSPCSKVCSSHTVALAASPGCIELWLRLPAEGCYWNTFAPIAASVEPIFGWSDGTDADLLKERVCHVCVCCVCVCVMCVLYVSVCACVCGNV
jgi:hypothetical protein